MRNVLIVDDVEINREELVSILEDRFNCIEAASGAEAIGYLKNPDMNFALVLLDLIMPDGNGFDVLSYMQESGIINDVPVIVETADSKEETILEAYSKGASDIITKPFTLKIIEKKIDGVLYNSSQKNRDYLTGGMNRAAFINEVEKLLKSVDDVTEYALYYFDINNIKAINEMFGTETGDFVIKLFYDDLVSSALHPILTSRLESDHFACIAKRSNIDFDRAAARMNKQMEFKGQSIYMYARFGVYYIEEDIASVTLMIDKAKLAKQSVVDALVKPYEVYTPELSRNYIGQAEALAEFEKGIENGEFKVYYQPIIEASTGKLASAEALVRWIHPKKGLLSPGAFIPALERNGHITKLDKFVLAYIRDKIHVREANGLPIVPTSVNLSWMDFYDESMRKEILAILQDDATARNKIRLEVTETSYAAVEQNNRNTFDRIREYGTKILLDDFGSGYSSFGMIEQYDFDIMKIDMSFVRKIEGSFKSRIIIEMLIDFCHMIGIKVVAEGVETQAQLDFLKDKKCDYIQGYYYSKPLSAEDFAAFAKEYDAKGMICSA